MRASAPEFMANSRHIRPRQRDRISYPFLRAFFLNYHDHRVHHEDPGVPWLYLPRYVDPDENRPNFGFMYLAMWHGPRPYPTSESSA